MLRIKVLLLTVALMLGRTLTQATSEGTVPSDTTALGRAGQQWVTPFTENMGQWPDSILFRAEIAGTTMWFVRDGVYYQYVHRVRTMEQGTSLAPVEREVADSVQTVLIKAEFGGAGKGCEVIGTGEMEYKCNYFFGDDASRWRTSVRNWRSVTFSGIYPGVNLRYWAEAGTMRMEVTAPSGFDIERLPIVYRTANGEIVSDGGTINISVPWGTKVFGNGMPVVEPNAVQATAAPGATPGIMTLSYSTYLGGSVADGVAKVVTDSLGQAYISGFTESADFPTQNAWDYVLNGTTDAFIMKLAASGSSQVYSTYLGGSGSDYATDIALGPGDQVYVTGYSISTNFPTVNAFQSSRSESDDVIVARLSSAGNSLIYSTYVGGNGYDRAFGIVVDSEGQAYIGGETESADFPVHNAYDATHNGWLDLFVAKLSAAGNSLGYATFVGGTESDRFRDIAIDALGQAYVAGRTISNDFPTVNAYDATLGGTSGDALVVKLSANGGSLLYSTYLGGNSDEDALGIVVDPYGQAYVAGWTLSSTFPTKSAFDATLNDQEGFVTKLAASGSSLVYSTFLGGSGSDASTAITLTASGEAVVAGYSASTDFPIVNAYDPDFNGGGPEGDVTLVKFTTSGSGLVYSTYLGGGGNDVPLAVVVDEREQIFVSGVTRSPDFPMLNAFDAEYGVTISDCFVSKLKFQCCAGAVGNTDCDMTDGVDVGDLTTLIDNLFVNFTPLCCDAEANCDGTGGVDVGDLTALIDNLFINFTPLPDCQ